jgi:hypothetical protein
MSVGTRTDNRKNKRDGVWVRQVECFMCKVYTCSTMPKDDVTLAQVLEAVNNGFSAIETKMATKDDLAALEERLKTELVEFVAGEFAELRTQDIEPMKRNIAALKQDVEKIRNTFAPPMRAVVVCRGFSRAAGKSSGRSPKQSQW